MDYGPSRRSRDAEDRYHLWDFESDSPTGPHPLSLAASSIVSIEATHDAFEPEEFVTWSVERSPWHLGRDWGRFS